MSRRSFVIPSGSATNFTFGGSAVPVDRAVTVSSGDTDLSGATVTISSGTLQSGDTLNFTILRTASAAATPAAC